MYTLLGLALTAFGLCLVFTPICRNIALRFGLVDKPDMDRKFHAQPVPRVGGVAIALAYTIALLLVFTFAPTNERVFLQHRELLRSLLPAVTIIFITGLLDDLIGLKPWQKLAGQVIAACVLISMGIHIRTVDSTFFTHHPALATPWLITPLTIAWLVVCANAVNLIDGLDGLAAGVGLFATVTTLLAAIFTGNTALVLVTLPLVGCLLAFLCFNFSPASIFLGDCGSLTIGFLLGCFGLAWSQHGGTLLGLGAPLMALALPVIDVGLAISRRYLRRVPIFKGDRGHIHHMVLARGFHARKTTLILYGVSAIAALLALLQSFSTSYLHTVVIALFILLVWSGVNYLNYIELGAAWRAFSASRLLKEVRHDIYLQEVGRSLAQASNVASCWTIVEKICVDLHFDGVELRLYDSHFRLGDPHVLANAPWQITLPLSRGDYIKLTRSAEEKPATYMMTTIQTLQEVLTQKNFVLRPEIVQRKPITSPRVYLAHAKRTDAA